MAPERVTEAEALDLAWDCLRESVRLRLESDVPLGLLLSGDRNAGGDLAIALAEMTGLAVRLFITKPQPVPSTNRVTTPTGPTCQLNGGAEASSADPTSEGST